MQLSQKPQVIMEKKITAKFIDNKRKMLQKNWSASQRDQAYLNMAREDFI